jgi:signal transduction histidine kinase
MRPPNRPEAERRIGIVILLAGAYFGAAKLGLKLAFVHASATAVWPPTGIALAALLVLGLWAWPGIFLGAFLANLATAGNVWTSLGIASGNTLEGIAGAWLVSTFAGGTRAFERGKDAFAFLSLASILSTTVSATAGVTSLALGGFAPWERFWSIWLTWWLGDATGALLVAPPLLLWWARPRWNLGARKAAEAALLLLLVFGTTPLFFGEVLPPPWRNYPLCFLCLPLLVWVALRLGPREAATATLVVSGAALWGTRHGAGPFAVSNPNVSLVLLQAYMGVLSLTALVLAAYVSEQERDESALLRAKEELEERVRERTASAQEASRLKSQVLAIVSHDLRSPLNSLLGFVTLIQEDRYGPLSEQQRALLRRVDANANRLSDLVTTLVDFQRLETGKLPLKMETLDLSALLEELADSFEPELREAGLELEKNLEPGVRLRSDPTKVRQIVQNLLANAIKFTEKGTIRFEMNRLSNDGGAEISVRDSGPGIPPEWHLEVFKEFRQLDGSFYRGPSGLGLGLTIAKLFAELLGGRIELRSRPGEGSTFIVRMPTDPESLRASESPTRNAA